MNSEELLNIAVEAENKKAEDIISLNMNEISDMTDYFVVCHGTMNVKFNPLLDLLKKWHINMILTLNVWKAIKKLDGYLLI